MPLLAEQDRRVLAERFAELPRAVRLVFFTQSIGCDMCLPTREILDELASLSDKLSIEEYNLVLDKEKVAEYGIDKVPAIALAGEHDTGIRFFGAPSGYEFVSLVDAIGLASRGESGLSEESRALVAAVDRPMNIQVFVTPT